MKKYFFTSESVTEGHPDKLCDTISDCILDEYLKKDENVRVAVETFASGNKVTIAGQITAKGEIDIEKLVREKIKEIGYDNANIDIDYKTCEIETNITKQILQSLINEEPPLQQIRLFHLLYLILCI